MSIFADEVLQVMFIQHNILSYKFMIEDTMVKQVTLHKFRVKEKLNGKPKQDELTTGS